jgi:hypothetical protein
MMLMVKTTATMLFLVAALRCLLQVLPTQQSLSAPPLLLGSQSSKACAGRCPLAFKPSSPLGHGEVYLHRLQDVVAFQQRRHGDGCLNNGRSKFFVDI